MVTYTGDIHYYRNKIMRATSENWRHSTNFTSIFMKVLNRGDNSFFFGLIAELKELIK
jgi:hypothetical protein